MSNNNLTSFSIQQDGTLIEDEQSQPAATAEVSQECAKPEATAKAKAKKPGQPKQAREKSGHEDTEAAEDTEATEAAENIVDADAQAILDDIDEDYSEALLEELDALQEELTSKASQPSMSLANKIVQLGEDFPVSNGVRYGDAMWSLPHGPHAHPNNIRFDRELLGSNDLKRALTYHTIPAFSPFSYIRSNTTTKTFGNEYAIVEQYIFKDNGLTAEPQHIALISMPMINRAFERAKTNTAKHHYFALFKHMRFWARLSEQKLLPEPLRLDVLSEHIDIPERRKEVVQSRFNGALESWIAYSEEDLEILMDYALFWLERVMPKAEALKDYLVETKFAFLKDLVVTRRDHLPELEALCTIEVDGKKVMSPQVHKHLKDDLPHLTYSWVTGYGKVLDGIRNSIFILVALVTGARKSELAAMHFSHVTQDHKGDYWLKITRWKTAASPKHGEEDVLPLPRFVGDMIRNYEQLRSIPPFVKEGWLFQPMRSTKVVNRATPSQITSVIEQLKNELPIERLHCHRFRKTIAEILINRDERNIDIIRTLFGHKSYAMTLRYIARNPLMVRSVALAIEQNYAREFHDIVAGLRLGHSGAAAERIYKQILKRPDEFAGQQFKVTIVSYVSHLLKAGEPLFIRRTALGTYCLSGERFTPSNLPPCLEGRQFDEALIMPDPGNCKLECKKIVMLGSARQALADNIQFYEAVLDNARGKLAPKVESELLRRIATSEGHLNNLISTGHSASTHIEVRHV
ncbi:MULTISPECIES: tyrosine-type recombinase/integrase [unclassified Pseudomonas]|nr:MULTISPECIES: tyrosine-type recombinase/integrase [unclassified Pseudomonas]